LTGDLVRLRKALEEYFLDRTSVETFLPRSKLVLMNKVQYPDAADEVIFDGQVTGHLYYEVVERKWVFKPLYAGVALIVEEKLAPYAVIDLPKITRNYEVKRDRIVEGELAWEKGRLVALQLKSGFMQGVAKVVRGRRLRVLKAWRARRFLRLHGRPTWMDVVLANKERLKKLEEEAISFIRELVREKKLPIFVSFSGGKDSLVTYKLAEKALGVKPPILFNDTGIELPGTVEYVREFAEREGVKLIVADAGDAFWRGVKVMGPPARDYRWCCRVAKLTPIARAVKREFPKGALSLVGQRKYESAARASSPRVWRNIWIPNVLAASPIQDWTALDVWLYIMKEKLWVNPLYYMGFDRLGCWLCPSSEMGEFEVVRTCYPDLWSMWEAYLKDYAERQGYPGDWVRHGLWRWVNLPGDVKRYAEKAGVDTRYEDLRPPLPEVSRKESGVIVRGFKAVEDLEDRVKALSPIIGVDKVRVEKSAIVFEGSVSERKAIAFTVRAVYCVACGACQLKCPTGAVKVDKYPVVNGDLCSKCLACNIACPISVFTLKMLGGVKGEEQ